MGLFHHHAFVQKRDPGKVKHPAQSRKKSSETRISQARLVPKIKQTYCVGVIKQCDSSQGFAIIESSGFDIVYTPQSSECFESMSAGSTVLFRLDTKCKGRPRVSPPVWKLVGQLGDQKSHKGYAMDYQGMVKHRSSKGCGIIKCTKIWNRFGRDAYVHKRIMEWCELNPGEIVRFGIHISSRGTPQVSAPCWKLISSLPQLQNLKDIPTEDRNRKCAASDSMVASKQQLKHRYNMDKKLRAASTTQGVAERDQQPMDRESDNESLQETEFEDAIATEDCDESESQDAEEELGNREPCEDNEMGSFITRFLMN